ncbi:MAG: SDR family oxidoreductase [Anaerolineales bacterium]|nr:SDR family oxidoreductase [Anaerolineales bacterium]
MGANDSFTGKRVLVTGADTGIGRGVAKEFAAAGAAVAVHYPLGPEGAQETVAAIRAAGGQAEAFHADFNDLAQVRALAAAATAYLGGLDVLVNNAGITLNKPFEQTTVEHFDFLFNVNIRAMFFLTQALVPALSADGGGAVVNLASIHAFAGMTEHTVYAATKGAIVAFTRVAAIELAQKGVRVNAIAPGWILTEGHLKTLLDFDEARDSRTVPVGFIGRPHDIGQVAMFLASDAARYINGVTLVVDGGQTAVMPASGDFRAPRLEAWGRGWVPGL